MMDKCLVLSVNITAYSSLFSGVFDPSIFILSTIGTGLFSCSANSVNQLMEVPFDSQMNRTKNRVLVRGFLTPRHAAGFAVATAATGAYILGCHVNAIAMGLGFLNLVLYTSVYTPMKRVSVVNTWVGSIVGAVPPLIATDVTKAKRSFCVIRSTALSSTSCACSTYVICSGNLAFFHDFRERLEEFCGELF